VAVFKVLSAPPEAAKYPHAARWYKHIATYDDDFATLPGDAAQPYTVYGPDVETAALNPAKTPAAEEDDDDVDLFGSDEEEDAEAARVREQRLAEYHKKKKAKAKVAAKSVVILDVKPWGTLMLNVYFGGIFSLTIDSLEDETDMVALEAAVRGIEKDGLVWGTSKLVPVGFGVKKLQINLVIEDEKISLSELEEEIQEFEDYVQSTDVATMQKL
jgi:elongation factor 1-beta